MADKNWLGTLAELKVSAALAEQRFYVFQQTAGNAPFDLVVYKDNRSWRISVKGTSAIKTNGHGSSYMISLRNNHCNTKGKTVKVFDSKHSDILAIYLHGLNKVCFIPSEKVHGQHNVCLREFTTPFSRRQFVISTLLVFPFGSMAEQ